MATCTSCGMHQGCHLHYQHYPNKCSRASTPLASASKGALQISPPSSALPTILTTCSRTMRAAPARCPTWNRIPASVATARIPMMKCLGLIPLHMSRNAQTNTTTATVTTSRNQSVVNACLVDPLPCSSCVGHVGQIYARSGQLLEDNTIFACRSCQTITVQWWYTHICEI